MRTVPPCLGADALGVGVATTRATAVGTGVLVGRSVACGGGVAVAVGATVAAAAGAAGAVVASLAAGAAAGSAVGAGVSAPPQAVPMAKTAAIAVTMTKDLILYNIDAKASCQTITMRIWSGSGTLRWPVAASPLQPALC